WGLFTRRKWAWGASLVLCGLLTVLVFILGVDLAVTLATEGFGRPHGVTAGGQLILCFLLPVALAMVGLPAILLWRHRRWFLSPADLPLLSPTVCGACLC